MSVFSRLFRKTPPPLPPQPPTLAQRLASLQTAAADVVVATALGNEDASLRVGAIRLLPDGDALRTLAGLATPPAGEPTQVPSVVRQAAHQRVAQLIDGGTIDFAALCSGRENVPETMTVAALCSDPDRLRQLIVRIDDPVVLEKLVLEGPTSRVRQSAAAAITDADQLHALLPRVRGKDKSVYKLIKQKCDVFSARLRQAQEAAREADELCAALEQHGVRTHDSFYAATLAALTARWQALATRPDPAIDQRGQLALERCRDVIATHEHEAARQAAEHAAAQAAQAEVRAARERAREEVARAAAAQAEADARESAEAAAVRVAEDRARDEQRAAETQAFSEISSLIRLARAALQGGNTRRAARFRLGLEEALQKVPAVPMHLARSVQQLDEALNELRQWKDYVVAPKRIELIEEMDALVGSSEEPAALAEHIRALQQEWRTINKGIISEAPADAERFQQAYQAAFKPCQEYFAAQAAVRRENLEARKRVLERLQAFANSQQAEHADYRLVAQVLREAPQEWRSHSPVDRDASRPAEIEFNQAMDRLRQLLNGWYERNEAEKKSLITQARQLAAVDDPTEAVDRVKRLHEQWKETGPVSREQSQALWEEFHGLCDAVYKRREQAYALYSAGLESAKAAANALCEQVEQAQGDPAPDRLAAREKIGEWHAAFDALGELPRADARGLHDRFERAIARHEARLAQQDLRDAEAAESNVFEAARHIQAYERAVMQDAPAEQRASLRSAAESFIAGVARWPKASLQALQQALSRAESASAGDGESRAKALRMLCIRGEILTSTPTPPADEELRREYQMQLLMQGLGQASQTDDRDWDAMLLEWIGIGAVAPEVHEDLQRRFVRCLAHRPAQHSAGSRFQDQRGGNVRAERDPGERKSRRRRV
jgi:hypothetical protein